MLGLKENITCYMETKMNSWLTMYRKGFFTRLFLFTKSNTVGLLYKLELILAGKD